jgi:pimeloyl-ACP methyl ester carboxylesterase
VEISYGTEPFPNSATLDRPIPTLFIHGDADTRFPVADSASAFSRAVGLRFLIVLHNGGHTPFSTWAGPVITNAVTDFLNLTLKRDPSARERLQIVGAVPSATFWAAS